MRAIITEEKMEVPGKRGPIRDSWAPTEDSEQLHTGVEGVPKRRVSIRGRPLGR